MPRGIYDRTKTKEQRASETKAPAKKAAKAAATAPQKRKYTKRAAVAEKEVLLKESATSYFRTPDDSFVLMTEVRQNLAVLTQLGDRFLDQSLQEEVTAHIELLGKLREKAFSTVDAPVADEEETSTDAVNTSNGAVSQYQSTVPLPPPPSVGQAMPPLPIPTH